MDCLPLQYDAIKPIVEARNQVVNAEPMRILCKGGILAIHDRLLNILILVDQGGDKGLCSPKGCAELPEDFIKKYQKLLISKSV